MAPIGKSNMSFYSSFIVAVAISCILYLVSENGESSIFRRRTESVETAANWTEKNTIDICLSPRTENAPF